MNTPELSLKEEWNEWATEIVPVPSHKSPEKVEAVLKAPRPCNVAEVRFFPVLVNYYDRFLPNLSMVVHALNQLLENNSHWK